MTHVVGFSHDLFQDRRIVINGAAGGIGQAIGAAFMGCGAQVELIDLADALAVS